MNGISEKLGKALENSRQTAAQLKDIADLIENDAELHNSEALSRELEMLKKEYQSLVSRSQHLQQENTNLRRALSEQIYHEKLNIIRITKSRYQTYFNDEASQGINKLNAFEASCKERIENIRKVANLYFAETKDDIFGHISSLENILHEKISEYKDNISNEGNRGLADIEEDAARLNTPVSEEQIRKRMKQNNIEVKIGLNVMNKVGVFLIIIGVIAAGQYTYFKLNDYFKSIFAFAVGLIFLGIGEVINRKKGRGVFSLGLTGGGVAILFSALAISYFQLKLLGMYGALAGCVLITAVSLVLSLRYKSQTIGGFSVVGGYLPMFSIGTSQATLYGAMVYFLILNFLTLILASYHKWKTLQFLSFVLNLANIIVVVFFNISVLKNDLRYVILTAYIIMAFLMYLAVPLAYSIRNKKSLHASDVILIAFNTLASSLIIYDIFYKAGWKNYNGLLAVIFTIIYVGLAKITEIKLCDEKKTQILFYLTGMAFAILIIPFQFGKYWLALGWLIEAALLGIYGILKRQKNFERGGIVIYILCSVSFLLVDVVGSVSLFDYKFFAYTLVSCGFVAAYCLNRSKYGHTYTGKDIWVDLFKYYVIFVTMIFANYIAGEFMRRSGKYFQDIVNMNVLHYCVFAASAFIAAYTLMRVKALKDAASPAVSILLYLTGIVVALGVNLMRITDIYKPGDFGIRITAIAILIVFNVLAILALGDLLLFLVKGRKLGFEWYPLNISLFFVILLSEKLIVNFDIAFDNMMISVVYVVLAVVWIMVGFIRRYAYMRRFGLALSVMSVAKLFIIDLIYLSKGHRIVSYFVFGIVLLAISFIYQYFSKKLVVTEVHLNE